MNLLRGSVSVERWVITALVLLCLTTAATSIRLSSNARALQSRVLSAEAAQNRQLEIQPGTRVHTLKGYDLDGREIQIDFGGPNPGAVLFVFAPDCPACDSIWEEWRGFAADAKRKGFRPVAVNLANRLSKEDKQTYVKANELQGLEIVANPTSESILSLRLRLTPQVIVIGPKGTVVGILTGGLSSMPRSSRQDWMNRMLG